MMVLSHLCRTHASSWLAVASWNAATAAMHDADDFLAAAVLFSASGSFQEALPCPTTGQLELRRVCACHHQ